MKISVVIPAYNAAGSIQAAIQSCIQQSLPAHEIIVVDDASTDRTLHLAKQFKQITAISLPQNSGPSSARNKGWDIATGDIIAFLDSDDTWLPDKLEKIHQVFSEHEEILYLGHPYTVNKAETAGDNATSTLSYTSIVLRNPFQPSCISVRKTLKEHFDETYRYCEDHELSIRVANKHTCYWIDLPLTLLGRPQLSAGGASGNIWKMRKGEMKLYGSIYKHNPVYIVFVPFLWVYSLGKMCYRLLFK